MAVVGIDLGTTNSLVCYLEGGTPRLVPNRAGQMLTPSVVGLDPSDRLHVGITAKNQLVASPDRAVAEVKRLMGTSERVMLGKRTYTATEISGVILTSLREDAERHLGEKVEEAVITVPAYFTDAQRKATKDAGELAGLRVERILNEPTAAALAYGIENLDKEELILVYDLGGGTFDVSVLELFDGVLEVKASAGNNRLGGSDFDRAVVAHLVAEVQRTTGADLRREPGAMVRLRAAAEQAKIELSSVERTPIVLPFLASGPSGSVSYEGELTRKKLEELVTDLVRETLAPMESALADAKIDKSRIHSIVLVGGPTRMPIVRRLVAETFGKDPLTHVNPDEAVAIGAAIQGSLKATGIANDHGIMITDVCPFTMGVEVQAAAGSQQVAGLFSPIIPRNSTIPISRTETYLTTRDNQTKVDIKVFQGESRFCKNNVFLDMYTVDGVPAAPAGVEKVNVTFTYDVNGILQVTTKIASTGKEAVLRVEKSANRMSAETRGEAKERLAREWTPGAPTKAAPVVDARALAELVGSAKGRLPSLKGEAAAKIGALVVEAEGAISSGDAGAIAKLEGKLTDALVELG